ncbi:protein unc-50 homolog isoform X2 [Notamacropus eugenii]
MAEGAEEGVGEEEAGSRDKLLPAAESQSPESKTPKALRQEAQRKWEKHVICLALGVTKTNYVAGRKGNRSRGGRLARLLNRGGGGDYGSGPRPQPGSRSSSLGGGVCSLNLHVFTYCQYTRSDFYILNWLCCCTYLRKMLPTTSMNSRLQGNGALNSRDAARHTAGAKRYKYLRRLFRFRQMDFEFAAWQMLYLFTSPQRVYRNFHYRKQTKDQWARDDPAFLVLLSIWLCVSTIGFGFVLDMGFFETIKLLLWVVFIDCVGVGLLISTLMWFISNKYLVKRQSRDYDVEWGYAFDVHLNAFYPLLVILHFIQLFFINYVIMTDTFIGYFVGNTLWLIAVGYYIYVTFLGYSALPFLKNTVILLYPFAPLILLYGLSLALGWNFTHTLCSFYKYRVK